MADLAPQKWRHILSLADFSTADYELVIQTATSFREVLSRRTKKVPSLQGKVVANLFFEPSTRTRNSFELAAKRLSADTLNFAPSTSSLSKGETILDTARTFLAMGTDIMVVRHSMAGVPQAIANDMDKLGGQVAVLNAGDGKHEHPSQALLDLFTICSQFSAENPSVQSLKDRKIVIIGDILHSRVARSNLWSLTTCSAEVHLVGPATLVPPELAQIFPQIQIHYTLDKHALAGADFVMLLRLQSERMEQAFIPSLREYHQLFGMTSDRLKWCAPHVKILHPGPVNRGVEISSELMDNPSLSLIDQQVTNGIAIRMALLFLLGTGGRDKAESA